jgi:hypothetical protein
MANRSNPNPAIGSAEAPDLAGSGEDYHISCWRIRLDADARDPDPNLSHISKIESRSRAWIH